ncbi:low-density lipoprotein receptor-related protein 2 [Galendromus occidentalis]|uniref:Low-density lipoprotein receptor-related protein 2 n=1 Tax=Galendromus occidentalis TaxID=34638 RepID=A0AAJ6VWE7_9ACAR|nr:low-density lipoprotein receptor-related protein 2 [Galendromus occidentalis]
MIGQELGVAHRQTMRRTLLVLVVFAAYDQVQCREARARCLHQVRTPSKCFAEGTCVLHARLTPSEKSTEFYCCKHGFTSSNNQCVDIDECKAVPPLCEHTCHNHPGTYSCGCGEGSAYDDATGACIKVSVCSALNCSHSCTYNQEGPVCDCPRGFVLESGNKCKAVEKICPTGYHMEYDSHTCRVMGDAPQMIFEYEGQAYEYPLREESQLKKMVTVEGVVNSIFYESRKNLAYFAGKQLTVYNFSTTPPASTVLSLPSYAISLAVDYVNDHVYVLDESSLDLWSSKDDKFTLLGTLIEHDGSMTSLAIDPGKAWLFYSSIGVVVRARLDGRKFSDLFRFYDHVDTEDVTSEVLAIDNIDLNDIFVFYAVNKNIFSFAVDGKQSLWVTDSLPGNVAFMDVFEDFIYYTMEGIDGIHSRTKDGLKAPITFFMGQGVRAIYVNHHYRQQDDISWRCSKKCDQICFRDVADSARCSCTSDYVLGQDKSSCLPVKPAEPVSPLGTPSPQIESREDSDALWVTTTSTSYNALLLVACILLVSVCVVQSLLVWWFYPRRRYSRGLSASFATSLDGGSSCVALDSVRDLQS